MVSKVKMTKKNHNLDIEMSYCQEKICYISEKLNSMLDKSELTLGEKKITLAFWNKLKLYLQSLYLFEKKLRDNRKNTKAMESEFNKYQRTFISDVYFFEKRITPPVIQKKVRELFRLAAGEYLYKSPIAKRAYEKPRGYPGDHLIFEMIYNNNCASDGIAYFLDKWILNHTLTRGTIYRKNKIKKILKEIITTSKNKIDILNVGCGSSREVRELISDKKINIDHVRFTCLDQDDEALSLSRDLLGKINLQAEVSLMKQDILRVCLNRKENNINKQDIVYSLGIADYLLKTMLENFIMFCYSLLKPKGKLIIALCSSHNPKLYIPLRWFSEWSFFSHRTNDINKFIRIGLGLKKVKIIWEGRMPIFFIVIEK